MKSPRDKGKRGEREVVKLLKRLGFNARRTGFIQSAVGREVPDVLTKDGLRIEVKVGSQVPKCLYNWLEGMDAVICRRDREYWLLIIPLKFNAFPD